VQEKFWDNKDNVRSYLTWLMRQLKIVDMEGWYRVTKEHLTLNYGGSLIHKYGFVARIVTIHYPGTKFPKKFTKMMESYL
jgi:hypothetical protein